MAKRKSLDRDAMWEAIRKKRSFTLNDISLHTDHRCCSIKDFLQPLILAGYVVKTSGQKPAIFKLVRDCGKQYPRLDKKGNPAPPSDTQRMWAALKVTGYTPFDCRDLAFVAKTEIEMARKYVRFLALAGYLRIIEKETKRALTKYLFVRARDSGPRAPELRARHTEVYDPNIREVVWKKGHVRALDVKSGKMVWAKAGAK
ncbi:MAG: hypothetical protein SFW64_00100 [Alphaproteobacteria bacterium]|nr:hypothetical protein [Alphaproteobacteria bacterium]